ncbi:MAG: ABC transporter permease [Chloroflexi bacterium]|mgnify:CR=1 FL=1|jgi:ABC-2 type transport system permease protein|nr:ABC transporter permease [Anaerolineaceae bacterium]NLI44949.1 ABC transporter permease [Chloroflexota bacterium]HOE35264.1 ABC transporter permease [Anaerolineaceae bacterium]HOT26100.1 ABC transporter permease [Anaerolineaceae bacterium]HQK03991.1 ABC transporter permease [Anaerolineaceae bacterium]
MKKLLAIIKKDTILRFTSPIEWMFFLILPVVFIYLISGGTTQSRDPRLQLTVVDQAGSALSNALLTELGNSSAVKPVLSDYEQAVKDFEQLKVSAILIIPADFNDQSLEAGNAALELRKQPNTLNGLAIEQAVRLAVDRVASLAEVARVSTQRAAEFQAFASEAERLAFYENAFTRAQTLLAEAPSRLNRVVGSTADPVQYDAKANSTAGQMITWVFIPLIGLSAMFAFERSNGTLRRWLVTPTSKATFLGGTILGQGLTALVQMTILIVFGIVVMGLKWGQSPAGLALVMISFTLAAAALGTMLGTFVKSEAQANGLSILIGMLMAMMGGCWYPIELFPAGVRSAAQALPTYWAMQGFLDIAVRGQGPARVLQECAVLLGFALLFFSVGIARFKFE